MKIGILCRENDVNLKKFIKKLYDLDQKNIFVIIEKKIQIKRSKIEEWNSENFDLSFFEKIISLLNSLTKRIIKKKVIMKENQDNFDAKFWCQNNNIKYIFSLHNSKESESFIKEKKIQHLFLLSGGIIKKNILNIKDLIIYNAHPGRLPRHRGLGSIEWSIIENCQISLTLHTLNHTIDGGEIIKIVDFLPNKNESLKDLKIRMIGYKPIIFSELVKNINDNSVVMLTQNSYDGILHRKLTRKEKQILEKKYINLKKLSKEDNA